MKSLECDHEYEWIIMYGTYMYYLPCPVCPLLSHALCYATVFLICPLS